MAGVTIEVRGLDTFLVWRESGSYRVKHVFATQDTVVGWEDEGPFYSERRSFTTARAACEQAKTWLDSFRAIGREPEFKSDLSGTLESYLKRPEEPPIDESVRSFVQFVANYVAGDPVPQGFIDRAMRILERLGGQ